VTRLQLAIVIATWLVSCVIIALETFALGYSMVAGVITTIAYAAVSGFAVWFVNRRAS
jgi:uncharacterized membrane-anchored protein